jgi:membrane protein DedA with SNARE-associated domain
VEGEMAVFFAGYLCRSGMMRLEFVMLCAFFGTLITEQCLFFVGRIYGVELLKKFPQIAKKSQKVINFLKQYDAAFIFGSRFIYGIRNISPIIIGMAEIPPLKFSSLNVPAAFVWSIVVAGAGYVFADAVEASKGRMQLVEIIALVLLLIALGIFVYKKGTATASKKKQKRK